MTRPAAALQDDVAAELATLLVNSLAGQPGPAASQSASDLAFAGVSSDPSEKASSLLWTARSLSDFAVSADLDEDFVAAMAQSWNGAKST